MNKAEVYESKVGGRGQVTIAKPLREKLKVNPGSVVEQVLVEGGILIRPKPDAFEGWRELIREVSDLWPAGVSAVEAVRESRAKMT